MPGCRVIDKYSSSSATSDDEATLRGADTIGQRLDGASERGR